MSKKECVMKYYLKNAIMITGLFFFLITFTFSCSKKPNTIPTESGNTHYIEGETNVINEGENEGIFEGEVKFTSAGISNTRNGEYGPIPTTDVEGGNEEGESDNKRELVEPDVYRRVNSILFVLNQYRGLSLVDLDEKKVVSNVPIYGYPRDLYIVGNRAYVLIGYTIKHTIENGVVKKTTGSQLYIVDIEDITIPRVVSSLALPGDFIDSRMLGDVLYAVTSDYQYYYVEEESEVEEGTVTLSEGSWSTTSGTKCWITSVDIRQEENPEITDQINFPGYGTVIQASTSAIYVCAPNWNNGSTQVTDITYVDITNASGKIEAYYLGTVPGSVADRFKLDEWNGVLRIVSNTWWPERHTYLTNFDIANPSQGFQQISQITIPDAQGETLYATRFAGDLAYLVTYLTIDPLFVIDLTDATKPEVKGQLKVPGWSVHIEPIGNNQLIALGVDDTDNQRRVKVSWFDVSDPSNPLEKSVVSLGEGWTWSSAFSDVKSFAVLGDLVIVPFSGWNGNEYKEQLQFISLQMDAQTLVSLGSVDMKGQVSRTIKYSDFFYAITSEYIHEIECDGINPPTLTTNTILLAENMLDVLEIGTDGKIAEIINHTEQKNLEIRLCQGDAVLNSIIVKTNGWLMETIKGINNNLILVINEWADAPTYESYYRVVNIYMDKDSNLSILNDFKISLTPYTSYWGWCRWCDYSIPEAAVDRVNSSGVVSSDSKKMMAPYYWWWSPSLENNPIMVCDNYLVLRGWGSSYNYSIGNQVTPPNQGFAIINIRNLDDIRTVGLGYNNIVSLSEASGKLFLTIQKNIDSANSYYPLVAYYLGEINLDALTEPKFVNVPGILQTSNEQGNILFLKDWQYNVTNDIYNYEQWIRSIQWEEDKPVVIIDSLKLAYESSNMKIYWPYLFILNGYSNTVLEKRDIVDGKFMNPSKVEIGEVWGTILGIAKNQLYLSIDGVSVLLVNIGFNETPSLRNIFSTPYLQKFRVGNLGVYIILGYSGYIFLTL